MKKLSILVAASSAALLMSGLSAFALESHYQANSSESVSAAWAKVGNFCGIGTWHPAVEKCTLSANGKERHLSLKGGGTIVEHLVKWNNKAHSYTYRIKSSPLPISNYESTIKVSKHGNGSVISWTGHYKAKGASDADAKKAVDGIYKSGVDSLAK